MGKARKQDRQMNGDRKRLPNTEVPRGRLKRKEYERQLLKLQERLCYLQRWIQHAGLRVAVLFEGRDAAGKGGVIKRITERVSPRVFRVVALPAPNDREKTQLYFQRYLTHLPAAGEVVLFDRSWYNRAGVERVMGFCSRTEREAFLRDCPHLEAALVRSGIILIKYYFDVSQKEQERRFKQRAADPVRQWKLSPMDLESYRRWWEYTKATDDMLAATDTEYAPWYVVRADDKRRARLNCIAHLLSVIPWKKLPYDEVSFPKRRKKPADVPEHPRYKNFVPEYSGGKAK